MVSLVAVCGVILDSEEITSCNGTRKGKFISLMLEGTTTYCSCRVTKAPDVPDSEVDLDIFLLTMNLTHNLTNLDIFINDNAQEINCPFRLQPHCRLANGTLKSTSEGKIKVEEPGHNGRIWIQINGSQPVTVTCGGDASGSVTENSSSNGPDTTEMPSMTEAGSDGAVAGGVTAAILIVAAVVILLLWFRYKRNRTSKSNPPSGIKTGENYSVASPLPDHNYHEIEPPKKQSLSNYDYATANGGRLNNGQENKSQSEDDYDRIGDQPAGNGKPNADDKSPGYDTTAAATESLQKFRNKKTPNQDNYYGYNHLCVNQQAKVLRDDYDTTASAAKVVAQMEANDQVEDDYDHFHQEKGGNTATDYPYDIAEHNGQQTGDYSDQ